MTVRGWSNPPLPPWRPAVRAATQWHTQLVSVGMRQSASSRYWSLTSLAHAESGAANAGAEIGAEVVYVGTSRRRQRTASPPHPLDVTFRVEGRYARTTRGKVERPQSDAFPLDRSGSIDEDLLRAERRVHPAAVVCAVGRDLAGGVRDHDGAQRLMAM